jgi:hypothetical protein
MNEFNVGMLAHAMCASDCAADVVEAKGGLYVDEDTLELAGKMEDVATYCYESFKDFCCDLLAVIHTAEADAENHVDAIETWLDANLEGVCII